MEWPLTLLDYAQESGRGGRDGQRSEAVVIAQEGGQWQAKDEQDEAQQARVRAFVGGIDGKARCRRVILDGYLDRREQERMQCEEGEEKCDVCRGGEESESEADGEADSERAGEADSERAGEADSERAGEADSERAGEADNERAEEGGVEGEGEGEGEGEEERAAEARSREQRAVFEQQVQQRRGPRQTWIAARQQEFGDMEWLRRQLAWWANRCGVCEAAGVVDSGHDIRQCRQAESMSITETIREIDKEIRYDRFAACYGCGVPQGVCNTWEDNRAGGYRKSQEREC
jgi:superfamily II DNA helicase RecQ